MIMIPLLKPLKTNNAGACAPHDIDCPAFALVTSSPSHQGVPLPASCHGPDALMHKLQLSAFHKISTEPSDGRSAQACSIG